MATDHVSKETAALYQKSTGSARVTDLLWGDRVRTLQTSGSRTQVKARGRTGWVKTSDLGGESLLEVYIIDVGQGDGVLVRTPDNRHILIDGGYRRSKLPAGKNAADFVDWKFFRDYGKQTIHLDAMIASHCDADHYGGLWDLVDPSETFELDAPNLQVDQFYHAGVSWWKKPGGGRWLGPKGDGFLTRLLGNRQSVKKGLDGPGPRLQGEWAQFLRDLHAVGCPITRLSHVDGHVPGFGPQDGPASLRLLAPVEYGVGNQPQLRSLGGNSQNTNGHSILIRLDYGQSKILLTGDLNKKSQRLLLDEYDGERWEFRADVAKGCHHGSDDVSYEFLQNVNAAATVISSGDAEGHAHPRPSIMAASATTGFLELDNDELKTPLVYSTEVSRSYNLGEPKSVTLSNWVDATGAVLSVPPGEVDVALSVTKAGALNPSTKHRNLGGSRVVAGIVYGLVNVRTDGSKILCATLNETKAKWDVKTFESRM